MAETRLVTDLDDPKSLFQRVVEQLYLLEEIGLSAPPKAVTLFELAFTGPSPDQAFPLRKVLEDREGLGISREQLLNPGVGVREKLAERIGAENARDLLAIAQVERVFHWFEELTRALATDVREVYRVLGARNCVEEALRRLGGASQASQPGTTKATTEAVPGSGVAERGVYDETCAFVRQASVSFETRIPRSLKKGHHGPIRPDLIHWSQDLEEWVGEQEEELDKRLRHMEIFEPEHSLFLELLRRFRTVAESFRDSAVVQKAVVGGVLGHHLLEELDEHVLELEEIAENLDPVAVLRDRQGHRRIKVPKVDDRTAAVSERFANYLLRRAREVSSIPKNLRSLYAILMPSEVASDPHPDQISNLSLKDLVERYSSRGWDTAKAESITGAELERLTHREAMHLELILIELHQNHLKYSSEESLDGSKDLVPSVELLSGKKLDLVFTFKRGTEHMQRLKDVMAVKAQEPIPPGSLRSEASSGTGLYLAKLAAAVVGWNLEIPRMGWVGAEERDLPEHLDFRVELSTNPERS